MAFVFGHNLDMTTKITKHGYSKSRVIAQIPNELSSNSYGISFDVLLKIRKILISQPLFKQNPLSRTDIVLKPTGSKLYTIIYEGFF